MGQLGKYVRNRANIWQYPSVNTFSKQSDEGNLLALHVWNKLPSFMDTMDTKKLLISPWKSSRLADQKPAFELKHITVPGMISCPCR